MPILRRPMNLFDEARYREQLAPLVAAKPLSIRQQRLRAWRDVKSEPALTPQHYILLDIARGVRLSKRHGDEMVFGSQLSRGERYRNYLTLSGQPFDLYIMSAIYDLTGSYNASDPAIQEWEETLWDIIARVPSSKAAREMLITEFLEQHGPYFRTTTTNEPSTDTQPAF